MGDASAGVLEGLDAASLGSLVLDAARAAGIGVTISFVDEARFAYVSQGAADIVGWTPEELLKADLLVFVAPSDLPRLKERLARRQAGEGGEATYEFRALRKDGREVQLAMTSSTIVVGGRRAVFTFLVDVSARHQAEEQRRQADARFRELIAATPEFIGIIRDGHFVYVNRSYATALGYDREEKLVGVPISTLVEQDEVAVQRERARMLEQTGTALSPHVYRAHRTDGSPLLLEVASVPFQYEGKPSILTMARDVTQKKMLEQQLVQADRLAALGTMAAGVAHEINNPLAYLMLNLEWVSRKLPHVMEDPASLPAMLAMLEEAREGAARVSAIVRELRGFARADGETRRPVDLEGVVVAAIRMVSNEVRHRARIETSFEPVRAVLANEARLEQVVVNLVLNAAQAMPEGSSEKNVIRVTIRPDASDRAVLDVHDNGPGIPAEVLPRIFDPFFSTKPVGEGTGLGLSICHGIVTALGGHISAYSDPSEGTTFRVVLPTTQTVAGDSTPAPSDVPPSSESPRSRVLVVDDEVAIAHTLRDLLAPMHEVVCTATAADALGRIAREEFDTIFCDLMMPGVDGIELYRRLKAAQPGVEDRIVFMTGGAFTERAADFLSHVPNRRLEKPFDFALAEEIVREMAWRRPASATMATKGV
jgi:PAS domain S-box-containing protein